MLERRIGAQTPSSNFEEERIRSSVQLSPGARSDLLLTFSVSWHGFTCFLLNLFQGRFSEVLI
jgi:hypothetical protein